MYKILHFSPTRKPPEILQLHLESLKRLENRNFQITFSFFDDNTNRESSHLLKKFIDSTPNSFYHNLDLTGIKNYIGDERWVPTLYHRITFIKNAVIQFFLEEEYDYLFLSDSDLIIHPNTINNLILQKKDFCSTIFWTHFDSNPTYTPNAWYSKPHGFSVDDLLKFQEPGTYEVDFTGACTLLSRKILSNGINFEKIPNVSYLGEDKHFCIRSSVYGFQAYVNTEYPSFHVYNEDYISFGNKLIENDFNNSYINHWLDDEWESKIRKWLNPKKKSFLKKFFLRLAR